MNVDANHCAGTHRFKRRVRPALAFTAALFCLFAQGPEQPVPVPTQVVLSAGGSQNGQYAGPQSAPDRGSKACIAKVGPGCPALEPKSATADEPSELAKFAGSLRIHIGIASPASAAPSDDYVPDTAPWVNVNRHFGAAIRTGRVVPVTPNSGWAGGQTLKDGGVYMVSGDWPGWARSVDGAQRFESAVSGRVSSKNVCGGYDADWYGKTPLSATTLVCEKSNQCYLPDPQQVTGPTIIPETGPGLCDFANKPPELCKLQVQCTGATDTNCRYCGSGEKEWCMKCTGGPDDALVNREWAESGPPSSLIAFHGAGAASGRDVTSGPTPAALSGAEFQSMCLSPANEPGCAKSVMYTANDWWTFFSPDAGRDWFRLTPQCEMNHTVGWGGLAADRGLTGPDGNKGGHLVALAVNWTAETPGPREASGCKLPEDPVPGQPGVKQERQCVMRSIAWTDDVGPELAEAMKASSGAADAWKGKSRMERAGGGGADLATDGSVSEWAAKAKWRYSSINHLPAPATAGGTCKVYQGADGVVPANSGYHASIPSTACAADFKSRCHGRRAATKTDIDRAASPADRDAWCLDSTSSACACTDGLPADCRYPNPTSVEIDPRNGWAYISSDAGLLSSPNGGGRWIREGGAPESNPADSYEKILNTPIPPKFGAKLYTKQYHCGSSETAPCNQDPDVYNSLELNSHPDRITHVGRMSLTFTPCATEAYYAPKDGKPVRHRGHLVATVPVEWIATPAAGVSQRVSSVFVAMQKGECDATVPVDEPGALVFWDTAHLELKASVQPHPDLEQDYNLRTRTYFGGDKPKLLRNLPLTTDAMRLRYTAAAVAPSDPRVMWAFSYGLVNGSDTAGTSNAQGHLLWRSLDAGATWRIALPARGIWHARALRAGGIQNAKVPELSIAPTNPHKVLLADSSRATTGSGADEAWIADPVPPAQVLAPGLAPMADCSACAGKPCLDSCRLHNASDVQHGDTTGCDPTKVPANLCGQLQPSILTAASGSTLSCQSVDLFGSSLKCSYPLASGGGYNHNVTYCTGVPPAAEASFGSTAKPANFKLDLTYDTMGTCVGCDEFGQAGTGIGSAPAACCVRWRNTSYVEAGTPTCEQAPAYDSYPTPGVKVPVTPWFTTRLMTTSRGASGSPDFSSAILPAAYSPIAATAAEMMVAGAPVVAVAGDDGSTSVAGLVTDPQNANSMSPVAAGGPELVAFAASTAGRKPVLWAVSTADWSSGGPGYATSADPKSPILDLSLSIPGNANFLATRTNYLRIRKIDATNGVTPAALAQAQTSPPVLLPSTLTFVTGIHPVTPPTVPPTYTRTFTTKSRLTGSGDILDGWSIPRLKILGDFLVFSSPGIGVLAMKDDVVDLPPTDQTLLETGKAHFVVFRNQGEPVLGLEDQGSGSTDLGLEPNPQLPFGPQPSPGDYSIGPGACVADIEAVGNSLFAVVAQQAKFNSTGVQSCAHVKPGLYRAERSGRTGTDCPPLQPFCKGFERVVAFTNPHSVEWIPEAASDTGRLVVADWSPAAGVGGISATYNKSGKGGGLWSCPVEGLGVANDPSRCHMIVQGDGIADVAAQSYPVTFAGLPTL